LKVPFSTPKPRRNTMSGYVVWVLRVTYPRTPENCCGVDGE